MGTVPTNGGVRWRIGVGRRWSLRARFVLIATACLLPLVGVVLFVFSQSLEAGRDQLASAQEATADVVAQVLRGTLVENERALAELAAMGEVRKLDPAANEGSLAQFMRARPNLLGLFLTDANGDFVTFAGMNPEPFRPAPSFMPAITRSIERGELGVSSLLGPPDEGVIAIVVPVNTQDDGQPNGAVGGLLSVERLRETVLPFARDETVIAIVAGKGGQEVITRASDDDLDQGDVQGQLAEPIAAAVGGALDNTVSYEDDTGVERLAAFAPVDVAAANWVAMVSHPAPAAAGPTRALLERGLAALALAVVATLVLAVVLGDWVARPLRLLTEQAAALAGGDFTRRPAPGGGGEVGALSFAFREMADRLATQVADLEAAREAGRAQAEQLRDLHRRTVRLQEDERRRIAAEIHDAVAPLITGALYQVRALRLADGAGLASGGDGKRNGAGTGTPDGWAANLDAVGDLLTRSMEELHNVIFALRPPDLDDIGVVAAIERYVGQIQRSGLTCRLDVIGEAPVLTPEVRLAIYRIVQEALHNALRHAGADEAVVRIEAIPALLRVTIRDNGAGFDPDHPARPAALGLLSMRERAGAIGATFRIASRPGDGTTVAIERRMEPEGVEGVEGVSLRSGGDGGVPLAVLGQGDERHDGSPAAPSATPSSPPERSETPSTPAAPSVAPA